MQKIRFTKSSTLCYENEKKSCTKLIIDYTKAWENIKDFHCENHYKFSKMDIVGNAFLLLTNYKSNGYIIDFRTHQGTNLVEIVFKDDYKKDYLGFTKSESFLYSLFQYEGMAEIKSTEKMEGFIIYKDDDDFNDFSVITKTDL